jgi:hypothetical protein
LLKIRSYVFISNFYHSGFSARHRRRLQKFCMNSGAIVVIHIIRICNILSLLMFIYVQEKSTCVLSQYFILLTLRKKNSWTQGPGFFFNKKLILDYYFCLKSGPMFLFQIIDIHTCLLDSTFLCPHLFIYKQLIYKNTNTDFLLDIGAAYKSFV